MHYNYLTFHPQVRGSKSLAVAENESLHYLWWTHFAINVAARILGALDSQMVVCIKTLPLCFIACCCASGVSLFSEFQSAEV